MYLTDPISQMGEGAIDAPVIYNDGTISGYYYHDPGNYVFSNNQQLERYGQHQMNNVSDATSIQLNHHPKVARHTTMAPQFFQHSFAHANMIHQAAPLATHVPIAVTMRNPTTYSTPVSASVKRGRNDTSGNSETNIPVLPQRTHQTRIFTSKQTFHKRRRGTTGHAQDEEEVTQQQNGAKDVNVGATNPLLSVAACRYATTRFPFAPFSIMFERETRDKVIVDDLIKHAQDNHNFKVKLVAVRRGRAESNQCRILMFVEDSRSFAFLLDDNHWPSKLAGLEFSLKKPSIPPQLALVLPSVSHYVDWEEFVVELKEKIPSLVNVIRFKNKDQQPLRSVKLELASADARDTLLDAGEIGVMHMKYKVVEYLAQAKVLICSNCFGIGHFRKNCPQGAESTCKTCGEKFANLKDHQCSGIVKCIHCGGAHASNDLKCNVVKDYRAALTRNLFRDTGTTDHGVTATTTNQNRNEIEGVGPYRSHINAAKPNSLDTQDLISKQLDAMTSKFEEEFAKTRNTLDEFKVEIRNRYEETNTRVDQLEHKMNLWEKSSKFSLAKRTHLWKICAQQCRTRNLFKDQNGKPIGEIKSKC